MRASTRHYKAPTCSRGRGAGRAAPSPPPRSASSSMNKAEAPAARAALLVASFAIATAQRSSVPSLRPGPQSNFRFRRSRKSASNSCGSRLASAATTFGRRVASAIRSRLNISRAASRFTPRVRRSQRNFEFLIGFVAKPVLLEVLYLDAVGFGKTRVDGERALRKAGRGSSSRPCQKRSSACASAMLQACAYSGSRFTACPQKRMIASSRLLLPQVPPTHCCRAMR